MKNKLGLLLSTILLVVTSFLLVSVTPALAETYTVKMGSDGGALKFVPDTLSVKPGDTIVWENNKLAPHNIVFDPTKAPDSLKSGSHKQLLFSAGDSYQTTIPKDIASGEYPFYCEPHRGAGMGGKIVVE